MVKGTVLHGYGKLKPIPVPEQTRDTLSQVYLYLCHALAVIQPAQSKHFLPSVAVTFLVRDV